MKNKKEKKGDEKYERYKREWKRLSGKIMETWRFKGTSGLKVRLGLRSSTPVFRVQLAKL